MTGCKCLAGPKKGLDFRRLQRGSFLSVVSTLHVFSAVGEVSRRDGHRLLLVTHV